MATLGVFLDSGVLFRVLRRRRVFEAVHLYEPAAREFGLNLVLFRPRGLSRRRRRVRGYSVPGFRPVSVPIPEVVHNRTLQSASSRSGVRWLQARGVHVFNPIVPASKHAKHLLLNRSAEVRPYLPSAFRLAPGWPARLETLQRRSGQFFVKPSFGSRGQGVIRIASAGGGRYRVDGVRHRVVGRRGLRRCVRQAARRGPHILQEGIELARYQGQPFDIRVHLQRGEGGHWNVPGMAARRAHSGRFVTNLTRGGSAHRVREGLAAAFPGTDRERIYEHIEQASLAVGRAMASSYPRVADLGLDVGLDRDAHPWILEVNLRMLRLSLRDTGEHEAWARVYRNPVAYAHHLLTTGGHMGEAGTT